MNKIGFRIQPHPGRADAEMLAQYRMLGSAQISDCMGRLYGAVGLKPFHRPGSPNLVGTALTVKVRPGDNLMIHKAISLSRAGDVIVVDGAGEQTNALVGELMYLQAHRNGVAGFVVDGAIRDADTFLSNDFPCFGRGISHRGPYKEGPGEINVPVSIGGQVVNPGDIVVGDADGVVFITAAGAPQVLAQALKKEAGEVESKSRILRGEVNDKSWIEAVIARKEGAL